MAKISAAYAIDMSALNLNLLYSYQYDSGFYDDINTSFNYRNYQDLIWVDWYYGGNYYESVFGGSSLTVDTYGNVTGGTVTGYIETYWTGTQYETAFAVEDIDISATSIWSAALTASIADDLAVVSTALAGDDTIVGSIYDDVLLGYDGNDSFFASNGLDEIYGGSGTDTYLMTSLERADIALVEYGNGYALSSSYGLQYIESVEQITLSDGTFQTSNLAPALTTTASPGYRYFDPTGDDLIDAMTNGYAWDLDTDRTIDFAIANGFYAEYWNDPSSVLEHLDYALQLISYYTDVTFNNLGFFVNPTVAHTYGAEITLSLDASYQFFSSSSTLGRAFFPNSNYDQTLGGYEGSGGDLYLNVDSSANYYPSYEPGSQGWFLLLHELGHALGLKHPHDDGGTGRPTFLELGIEVFNDDIATIMSYNDTTESLNQVSYDPATPMVLDVLALQYLFGKNTSTNSDDSVYDLSNNEGYYLTIWDAGGTDRIDASSTSHGWGVILPSDLNSTLIDTNAGYCYSLDANGLADENTLVWLTGDIENVTGSDFDDQIQGNSLANSLIGGAGDDLIYGGGGDDWIESGLGFDSIYGEDGNDTICITLENDQIIDGGSGLDMLLAGADGATESANFTVNLLEGFSYLTAAGAPVSQTIYSIENCTVNYLGDWFLTGTESANTLISTKANSTMVGMGGNDNLIGGTGIDSLDGGDGQDILNGGAGDDWINGGAGNDVLRGGVGLDTYLFEGSFGHDTVYGYNVEEDTLIFSDALGNEIPISDLVISTDSSNRTVWSLADNSASVTFAYLRVFDKDTDQEITDGTVSYYESGNPASTVVLSSFAATNSTIFAEYAASTEGAVGISDVITQLRHIVGLNTLTGVALGAADNDGDGSVAISDVISSLRLIVGLQEAPNAKLVTSSGQSEFLFDDSLEELYVVAPGDADLSWSAVDLV